MLTQGYTSQKPANGTPELMISPAQNEPSSNYEQSEMTKIFVQENKSELAKKKTCPAWIVYLLIALLSLSVLGNIVLGVYPGQTVNHGKDVSVSICQGDTNVTKIRGLGEIVKCVSSKCSPMDRCPSCAEPCPQGWVVHESWCYYFSTAEGTWNYSQSNCSSQGGSLTAIDTQRQMDFLLKKKEKADYWIGLEREEGQPWKWSNGSDFNSWFPVGADGLCAYLNDRNASSSWCSSKRQWICRKPRLSA